MSDRAAVMDIESLDLPPGYHESRQMMNRGVSGGRS
jgi:hypothetical protein